MTRAACPPSWDLIAYQDNELSPAQQEDVDLHVLQCSECRARLGATREVGRLVQAHNEPVDDPEGLAALRERLGALPGPDRPGSRRVPLAAGAVALALIVAVGLSIVSSGGGVEGGNTFGRWLVLDDLVKRVAPSDGGLEQPAGAPTGVARPTSLPFGLGQVGEEDRSPGFVGRHYQSPDGLTLFFTAERSDAAMMTLPTDQSTTQRMIISGHEVLLSADRRSGAIVLISWVDGDSLVRVLVLNQPPDGLDPESAVEIAEALISADLAVP